MTTERKLQQAMQGATSAAVKVLNAVPIKDPWSSEQIVAELRRSGTNVGVSIIHGCLDNLRGRGLITEPTRGMFIRVQARPRASINDEPNEDGMASAPISPPIPGPTKGPVSAMPAAAAASQDADPVSRLADLAKTLRQVASTVEDVALDVQQKMDAIRADGAKLQQLRDLLKGIA